MEVWTQFEGNEFRMDTLGPGSVINYRSVFLRDHMYVEMRAITEVKVLDLPLDTLLALSQKHGEVTANEMNEPKKFHEQKHRI